MQQDDVATMNDNAITSPPADFEAVGSGLGFIDAIQPFYRRIRGTELSFGLVVQKHHCNRMDMCHGAVLMTLADITAVSGISLLRGMEEGTPTVNLTMNFVSSARAGDWLQADVEKATLKRRLAFCGGTIYSTRGVVAHFDGVFYLPDEHLWKGKKMRGKLLED